MAAEALLFDVDGTLWDSPPWYAQLLSILSGQSADLLERRLREGGNVATLHKELEISRNRFCRFGRERIDGLQIYDGVAETLRELYNRDVPLGIVTNLPESIADAFLEQKCIRRQFLTLVGARRGLPLKPKPNGISMALSELALSPSSNIVYVGDTDIDARAARAAGVSFVWAAYGYGLERPKDSVGVIGSFREVMDL